VSEGIWSVCILIHDAQQGGSFLLFKTE